MARAAQDETELRRDYSALMAVYVIGRAAAATDCAAANRQASAGIF